MFNAMVCFAFAISGALALGGTAAPEAERNTLTSATSPSQSLAPDKGQIPADYKVVTVTESGRRLVAHKANARSVQSVLAEAIRDFSKYFDAKPAINGAFAEARERRYGGASFTARFKGQAVKGTVFCNATDQGADVAVTYWRADAPAAEWTKLGGGVNVPGADGASPLKTTIYSFPDGTGSIDLPNGWNTSSRTCIQGIHIEGPAGQMIAINQTYTVNTPDSFAVQTQIQLVNQARQMGFAPPPAIEMLIAPYTEPVEAMKSLIPQISQMSYKRRGPTLKLDRILEPPKSVQAAFPNGRAASVYFAITRETNGVAAHYRSAAQIETWSVGPGAWCFTFTELAAPEASFETDLPVMHAILSSLKVNPDAMQRETGRAIQAMNRRFEVSQRLHAENQKAFEDYFQSQQRNSIIRDRSAIDFAEVIRGERTVEDTTTGGRRSVDLGNVDDIVDALNRSDPGRYIQIPLRDELAPLPDPPR